MKYRVLLIVNTVFLLAAIIMFEMDTNQQRVEELNNLIEYIHEDLCGTEIPNNIPNSICGLIKYNEDFMANYIDDISLNIDSYEDVEDFINSVKIEGQTYVALYTNRSLWKFVEYSIKDKETIEDYWKIKYYSTLNIGRYNTLIMEQCKLDNFFVEYYDKIIDLLYLIAFMVNLCVFVEIKMED